MLKRMILEFLWVFSVGLCLLLAMACSWLITGCDENDPYFPGVEVTVTASPGADPHGTIRVSPSPLPPFEIQFKEELERAVPTPIDL